jgi:dCTP deaminase
MILTGSEIVKQVLAKKIEISPFDQTCVTTNSYDLTLGRKFIKYKSQILDPRIPAEYEEFEVDETEGLLLVPGDFVLGHTREVIGSDHYVPLIHAKSGVARLGLFVHVTADLIDIGSHGCSTLQIYATLPVKIFPGTKFAQVTFWVPKGDITLYRGKYQNSNGPKPSMTYLDYQKHE